MRVVAGALAGILLGVVGAKLADVLPRRYGIVHRPSGSARARRNVLLVLATSLCSAGIAHIVGGVADLSLAQSLFYFALHAIASAAVLTGAAIDLEHMILPNELTIGPAVLCLAASPLRAMGIVGALAGAVLGFAVSYLPVLLYKRLRGQSGMGFGDAKLAITAGAWHGVEGALFVLFAAALQTTVVAGAMRVLGLSYDVPESVKAEIRELQKRADAGDEEAQRELDDDPMAAEERAGTLAMRLPLGPFLALGCIEVLFLRRWLHEHVLAWLLR